MPAFGDGENQAKNNKNANTMRGPSGEGTPRLRFSVLHPAFLAFFGGREIKGLRYLVRDPKTAFGHDTTTESYEAQW